MKPATAFLALLLLNACSAETTDRTTTTAADETATDSVSASMGEAANLPPPDLDAPPAAVDACASQSPGEPCSFTLDGRELSGACRPGPDPTKPLACAPDAMLPKPPAEAVDACESHNPGDACGFTIDGHPIQGECRPGPDPTKPLACAPTSPLPNPPLEAIAACQNQDPGSNCAFTIDGQTLNGECRPGPDPTKPLACAPANLTPPPGAP